MEVHKLTGLVKRCDGTPNRSRAVGYKDAYINNINNNTNNIYYVGGSEI